MGKDDRSVEEKVKDNVAKKIAIYAGVGAATVAFGPAAAPIAKAAGVILDWLS